MDAEDWSEPMDFSSVCHRAGGRRRYNAWRSRRQAWRRAEVARLLKDNGEWFRHGLQAELARELKVSRSTICRDIAYFLSVGWPCPHCEAYPWPPKPLFVDDPEEDDDGRSEPPAEGEG